MTSLMGTQSPPSCQRPLPCRGISGRSESCQTLRQKKSQQLRSRGSIFRDPEDLYLLVLCLYLSLVSLVFLCLLGCQLGAVRFWCLLLRLGAGGRLWLAGLALLGLVALVARGQRDPWMFYCPVC